MGNAGAVWSFSILLALVVAACGADSKPTGRDDVDPEATGGMPAGTNVSLEFEAAEGLTLGPREQRKIEVRVKPRGAHTVRFSLLGASPDVPLPDAALDRIQVVSEPSGVASVTLIAPSTPASLFLQAQVGKITASLPIMVSSGAVTTLDVRPVYSGTREILEWVASVHLDARCTEHLSPPYLDDGRFLARAPYGAPLQLLDVPTAPMLAIVVRAGHFASGCATLSGIETDVKTSVSVSVSDRPLDLARTRLDVLLGVPSNDAAFESELLAESALCAEALRNGAEDDVAALLDAMQSQAPPGIDLVLGQARLSDDFDALLLNRLGHGADTRMVDAIERWSQIAKGALLSPRAIEGVLSPGDLQGDLPSFELVRLAELSPDRMAASFMPLAWSVDASDTFAFSGDLSFSGSLLFTSLVEGPALAETGESETSLALSRVVDCAHVADILSASVSPEGIAFSLECGLGCVEGLCQAGVWAMWQRARDASGSTQRQLSVRAAGRARAGEFAEVIGAEGSFIGKLSGGLTASDTGGTFKAFLPR
jgi:hypothetical protein